MADNYLITGYWGEPHVTAENDRGINAAIFGGGRFVLPVGEQFRAEYIGNNTVRMYDGKLLDNGAAAGIPAGRYIDLLIPEAGQGKRRNDLIVFQYSKDSSSLIESGIFTVLKGAETSEPNGIAEDPALRQDDLLSDKATFDQMALWRVNVEGANISQPAQVFEVSGNIKSSGSIVVDAVSDDGVAYSATVPGISELYNGLEITVVMAVESASTNITLNVNGFGAKYVRVPLSFNTASLTFPTAKDYFTKGRAVKLMYDAAYVGGGTWKTVDKQKTSAEDLYGVTPVKSGGTGANSAQKSRENLEVAQAIESQDYTGCYYRIVDGETEWINPPMVVNSEYRTTERSRGYPVYTKLINCGVPTDGKTVSISINADEYYPIRSESYLGGLALPFIYGDVDNAYSVFTSVGLDMTGNIVSDKITIHNGGNFNAGNVYVQIWYIAP